MLSIFLHPDAFLRRWKIYPDGKRAKVPFLDETIFEKGFPFQYAENTHMRTIKRTSQAIVINIRNKRLIILRM
jgi:hypothetical protein